MHVSQASSWKGVENWAVFLLYSFVSLYFHPSLHFVTQDEIHRGRQNSCSKKKSSRYWMPLSPRWQKTHKKDHCVRHSKGSYQSREISHTDIHSHARTHCMHCFWKFWCQNTSIFPSTSCNWQPCLVPHDITHGYLKHKGKIGYVI